MPTNDLIIDSASDLVSAPVSDSLIIKLLSALNEQDKNISALLAEFGINHRTYFRKTCIHPALTAGYIELIIHDKPSSSNQKYRITALGRTILSQEYKK